MSVHLEFYGYYCSGHILKKERKKTSISICIFLLHNKIRPSRLYKAKYAIARVNMWRLIVYFHNFIQVQSNLDFSAGEGGWGGGVWFLTYSIVTCTGKGVKIFHQSINGSELTVMMILLADWRC